MNDVPKTSLAVLRQVAEFLEGLPVEQVEDLAEGRARLTLIPWGSSTPIVPAAKPSRPARRVPQPTADVDDVAAKVESADSREVATAALNPLKLPDLKAVAARLGITSPAGTRAPLINQIVELTVGARLTGEALRAL